MATGELGELGIAPKHAPLITRLKPGKVVVTTANGEQLDFAISGGILEVQPQVVTILVDTAVRAQDIDEAAVRKVKEEAERLLANRGNTVDVAEAQRQLAEATVQLQALERLRRKPQALSGGLPASRVGVHVRQLQVHLQIRSSKRRPSCRRFRLERCVRVRESATACGRHTACLSAPRHGSGAWQRYPGTLRKVA